MNCKPGDLAVIVRSFDPNAVGQLVTVLERAPEHDFWLPSGMLTGSGPDAWVVSFAAAFRTSSKFGGRLLVTHGACRDAHLRPIRDPGEDARDETLAWLPVPSVERAKEPA